MIWFTSDLHFNHQNILKYDGRPFETIEEHNQCIIHNINKLINPYDILYVLGDFGFGSVQDLIKLRRQIHCNIVLVVGNHDYRYLKHDLFRDCFIKAEQVIILKTDQTDYPLTLCHYPMLSWYQSNRGAIHLYGHDHKMKEHSDNRHGLNVGIHFWDYYPIHLDQIVRHFKSSSKP